MRSRIQIWAMLLILPLLTSCSDEESLPVTWPITWTVPPEMVWTDGTQWWEAPYIDPNDVTETTEVLTTNDGLTYSTDLNHYWLKRTDINDKEYLRVWKNGSPTDQYVRLEDDIVYAYSPQTGNEIVMYDFSSPLLHIDYEFDDVDPNATITFNGFNADGSVKTVTEHIDSDVSEVLFSLGTSNKAFYTPQGRRIIENEGMYMGEGLVYSYSLNDDCDIPNSLLICMPKEVLESDGKTTFITYLTCSSTQRIICSDDGLLYNRLIEECRQIFENN